MGGVVLTIMQSSMGPRMIHQIFLFLLVPQHLRQRVGCRRLTAETVKTPSSLEEGSLGVGREGSNPFLLGRYFYFLVNQESGLHANSLQCILLHIFPCSYKHKLLYGHTSFSCASVCCTLQILRFLQIEGLWQVCIGQVYWRHFFQQHLLTSCMSLCHILVIFTIFQAFSLLLHLLW